MTQCTYHRNYRDLKTGKEEHFECREPEWKGGRCKFHSKHYLKNKTEKDVIQEFEQLLDREVKISSVLLCIGYHLPSISLESILDSSRKINMYIYFNNAKFYKKIDFSDIKFSKHVSFTETEFYDTVSFRASEFSEDVDFSHAKFKGNSNSFQFTKFEKQADFSHGEIRNAKFIQTEFAKVNFNYRTFVNNTFFANAKFHGTSVFKNTIFQGKTDFSESIFSESVVFENTEFAPFVNFIQSEFKGHCIFNGNISNVSFLGMEIDKIKFGNEVSWKTQDPESKREKIKSLLNWVRNSDFKIFDERNLENQFKENKETIISLESIKNLYRDLRDNFDLRLRYETSGEFHVREMELKRKYREKHKDGKIVTVKRNPFLKHASIHWAYNILAQYGQSYYRPIYFAVIIISIASVYFLFNGVKSSDNEQIEYSFTELLLKSIARSIAGLIPFDIFNEQIEYSDRILRVTLLPVSATFFIALKRRLERKFRH